MMQKINQQQFIEAFRAMNRDDFSYEGYETLYNYFEEVMPDWELDGKEIINLREEMRTESVEILEGTSMIAHSGWVGASGTIERTTEKIVHPLESDGHDGIVTQVFVDGMKGYGVQETCGLIDEVWQVKQ